MASVSGLTSLARKTPKKALSRYDAALQVYNGSDGIPGDFADKLSRLTDARDCLSSCKPLR